MNIIRLLTLAVLWISSNVFASPQMQTFTFVYILTGPATDIDAQTQQEAFKGHFSNMSRMAEDGDLLIAGPYWQPQTWDDMRGMWIFATDDIDEALKHAGTDPTGQLGIFVFQALQLKTDDQLMELPRLEREEKQRRAEDPNDDGERRGRGYFWATAPIDETNEPNRVEGIALLGTLIGHEDTRVKEDHWLILLDATTPEDANQVLKDSGCDPENWNIDQWYGSAMPAKLPTFRE